MGTQSTAKTIFLLASMVGWLIVGASLMYLFPATINTLTGSEMTQLWMKNLARSGYNPSLALEVGGLALVVTIALNLLWYQRFENKV